MENEDRRRFEAFALFYIQALSTFTLLLHMPALLFPASLSVDHRSTSEATSSSPLAVAVKVHVV